MKRIVVVCFAGTWLACGEAPTTHDAGTDANTITDAHPPMEAATKYVVSGIVVDETNTPWPAAKVQVCGATLCTLGDADTNGAFHVSVPPGANYHVIARAPPTDARITSGGFVLVGDVSGDVSLAAPVAIPVTGAKVPVDADAGTQTAAVTSDLSLTMSGSSLAFYGEAYLAGVSLTPAQWPPVVISGKTVIGMWALAPWGTLANASATVGVTITNGFGLTAGDTASVYAVSELTAELGPASLATVSANATKLTGATIDRVTWIVLAR